MEDRERQIVLNELQSSRQRLHGLTDSLTPEQWGFKPAADRWSINEVVEHLVSVENRVLGIIEEKAKGTPETGKRSSAEDAALRVGVPDRSNRRQAPEIALPSGKWPEHEAIREFDQTRARSEGFAGSVQQDLRCFFHPHGLFGELDCYQWLLLLGLHTERHARQIEEVKAASGFPREAAASA